MTRPWTDHDLERYHDADLPASERDALSRDLMRDAALRERLNRVRELDTLAREALLGDFAGPTTAMRGARAATLRRRHVAWRLGAGLAACAAAALLVLVRPAAHAPAPAPHVASIVVATADPLPDPADAREGLLLVRASARWETPAPRVDAPRAPTLRERVDSLVREGDPRGALALLTDADADGAAVSSALLAIGEGVRSGDTARELLASLPIERQIEACRAWVERPALRPVAFEWLASLERSSSPEASGMARALRDDLSHRPELRPWLLSYAAH